MLIKHRIRVGIAALAIVAVAAIGANVAFGGTTQALAKDGQEKTTKAACSVEAKAKRFENTEAAVVFAWLRENGIHLAIEDEHVYTGALLTLSLDTGRPATSVAKLASALHLQPTKRGEYYALVRGIGSESASEILGGEDFARGYDQENPWRVWSEQQRKGEDGNQRWRIYSDDEGIDIDVLMQEFEGKFKFDFDFEDFDFDFEFDFDEFMQEHRDFEYDFDFDEFMQEHGDFDFDFDFDFDEMFDGEFMSEMEFGDGMFGMLQSSDQVAKRLQEANEKMKNKLSKEQIAELAEILSQMPHRMVMPRMMELRRSELDLGELKKHFGEGGDFSKRMEKMQAEMKKKMAGVKIKLENLKKFMKSLTAEQKKLAKEQGYLKLSDLTKDQRKLLGGLDDDDELHMKFKIGEETIVIKGDGK